MLDDDVTETESSGREEPAEVYIELPARQACFVTLQQTYSIESDCDYIAPPKVLTAPRPKKQKPKKKPLFDPETDSLKTMTVIRPTLEKEKTHNKPLPPKQKPEPVPTPAPAVKQTPKPVPQLRQKTPEKAKSKSQDPSPGQSKRNSAQKEKSDQKSPPHLHQSN